MGVVEQDHIALNDLTAYHANKSMDHLAKKTDNLQMKAAGIHLTPISANLQVKANQLGQALSKSPSSFGSGLLNALDLCSRAPIAAAEEDEVPQIQIPDSITTRVDGPKYITDEGVKAIDVTIHYGTPDGGGRSVSPSFTKRICLDVNRKRTAYFVYLTQTTYLAMASPPQSATDTIGSQHTSKTPTPSCTEATPSKLPLKKNTIVHYTIKHYQQDKNDKNSQWSLGESTATQSIYG
jgi:hypothetical protein